MLYNVVNTLAPSCLIGSFSFLQVTRTTIKSRMSSKVCQIGLKTAELAALKFWKHPHRLIMGKCCDHSSSFIFDGIIFILASNMDMHESLDEFKLRPDTSTDSGDICPWASEKLIYIVVNTLAPSCLIGSSLFLQITRTTIRSRMSSKFGQIRLWTAELAALECLNKSFTYLRSIQNIFMTCWLSCERSLPFGLLVLYKYSFEGVIFTRRYFHDVNA